MNKVFLTGRPTDKPEYRDGETPFARYTGIPLRLTVSARIRAQILSIACASEKRRSSPGHISRREQRYLSRDVFRQASTRTGKERRYIQPM